MTFLGSPARTLRAIVLFLAVVVALATLAYMAAGWSLGNSLYMVLLTVYSVGYEEVHPIDTTYLHVVTLGTMILGCTGVILFTGALAQTLTVWQLQQLLGKKRMTREIEQLSGHVIVVGLGRIGMMLAKDLKAGGTDFLVVDADPQRIEEAQAMGILCVTGDGTDEAVLKSAGIERARALASVLPNDAANVFITLSARSLNRDVTIIARGEMPATERKLRQAGADHVVLPAHIGAERVAEVIFHPAAARLLKGSRAMQDFERMLRGMGLETEIVMVPEKGALTGRSIAEIEGSVAGRFLVVQVLRGTGEVVSRPGADLRVEAGDGVVIVGREVAELRSLFQTPAAGVRAGRQVFPS